jgi:hypothetical protein
MAKVVPQNIPETIYQYQFCWLLAKLWNMQILYDQLYNYLP